MSKNYTSNKNSIKETFTNTKVSEDAAQNSLAEKYVKMRNQKAQQQGAKMSQQDWNEMTSYKYPIL